MAGYDAKHKVSRVCILGIHTEITAKFDKITKKQRVYVPVELNYSEAESLIF